MGTDERPGVRIAEEGKRITQRRRVRAGRVAINGAAHGKGGEASCTLGHSGIAAVELEE